MTPPKERKSPAILTKVSLSRKKKYATIGENTGIVAMITEVVVGEEYFSP